MLRAGVVALALAAGGAALAAKAPVQAWTAATVLASRAAQPQAGIAANGDAVVVSAPGLEATALAGAARLARGRWTIAPVAASEDRSRQFGNLAVGASGDAVILASTLRQPCNDYRENCHRAIQAFSRAPSGSWSVPVDISDAAFDAFRHGGGGDNPSVAVDRSGGAVAAWISWDGGRNSLLSASRAGRAGTWTAPVTLWGDQVTYADAATNPEGSALVAFATYDGAQSVIRAVRRPGATAAWLAPEVLGNGTVSTLTQVEVAPDGRALVAWCTYRGFDVPRLFQVAVFDGKGWATADMAPAGDCGSSEPAVALQPGGRVLAVWTTSDRKLVAASSAADLRTWSQPVTVSLFHGHPDAGSAVVASGPGGHVVATWRSGYALLARVWDPRAKRWSPTAAVDDHQWITSTTAAVDARGDAVVAWLRTVDYRGAEGELRARTSALPAKNGR